MTKSVLVLCIIFSFLTFNVKSEDVIQEEKPDVALVEIDECSESDFDEEIIPDDIEDDELSFTQKVSLLIQFLKLKSSVVKDNAIEHVKNNKKAYIVGAAVVGSLAVGTLIIKYYKT